MKIVLFHIFLISSFFIFGQSYPFKKYSTLNGMTSNIVYDAIQDDNGFMWFATNIGVSRFDGKNWINYTIEDGLSDNEIVKIKKDGKGRIWLLAFNGTVTVIHNEVIYNPENCEILKKIEPGMFYRYYYSNKDGTVLISNSRNSSYRINFPNQISEVSIDTVMIYNSKHGGVYINKNDVFFKNINGTTTLFTDNKDVFKKRIVWYNENPELFLSLTENDFYVIDSTLKTQKFVNKLLKEESINMDKIIDIYFKHKNSFWVTIGNKGVLNCETKDGNLTRLSKYFENDFITSVFIDNEENHWFTTYGNGVMMLPRNFNLVKNYSRNDGLFQDDVFSVCVDRNQRIWAGHKNQCISIIDKNKIVKLNIKGQKSDVGRIGKIIEHPLGGMVISHDRGILMIEYKNERIYAKKKIFVEIEDGIFHIEQPIKDFVIDKTGNIILASQENINIIQSNQLNSELIYAKRLPFESNRTFSVSINKIGQIYFSDAKGLVKIEGEKMTRLSHLNSRIKHRIEDMEWIDDLLFLSISGNGIFVLQNDQIIDQLEPSDGLLSKHITRLYCREKKLFVGSNQGINVIEPKGKDFEISRISTASISNIQQVNDVFANDNVLFAASLNGITIMARDTNDRNLIIKPKILFTSIIYKNKDIKNAEDPKISFTDRHLTFNFTYPTFFQPEGVRYEYRLNDNKWIGLQSNSLELNELRPGSYILYIKAKDFDGNWSRPIKYSFDVLRPFYLSWWFYGIILLGLISGILVIAKNRMNRLKEEQKIKLEYEQKINKLQLQSLQAMMNPHFIFNSLSAIQLQINAGENNKANSYLTRFSKLLRKNLETINESSISLDEEIERLKLYLDTEKMRLENILEYEIFCENHLKTSEIFIPTMVLQPLVENAIWHGIMPSGLKGKIKICFFNSDQKLIIIIEDNGIGYNKSIEQKQKNSIEKQALGMKIIYDRLKHLSVKLNNSIEMDIIDLSEEKSHGTRIKIEMNCIYSFGD